MSVEVEILQRDAPSPTRCDALRVEICDGVAPSLHAHWSDLERRSVHATIFQSPDWCRAWIEAAQASGEPEQPRIVTIWRGDRLVLLWPLAVRRLSVFRILHALGEPATQYGDLLVDAGDDEDCLVAIACNLVRSWTNIDVLELRRVREGTPLAECPELARHAADGSQAVAPLLDFRALGGEAFDGQRTSRSRNALRRHQRQLAQDGEVGFEIVERPDAQCAALVEAFAFKRQWQAEKSAVSTGYAHRASEGSLLRLAQAGQLFVARLTVGGRTVAVEIGAIRRRRYWSLVQSYDLRFARHAPGRLLFWRLLERCPDLGIDLFDFLAPAHAHKLEWANDQIVIRDYLVPVSLKGRAAVSYLATVKPKLRAIYGRLPPGLRRHAGHLAQRLA